MSNEESRLDIQRETVHVLAADEMKVVRRKVRILDRDARPFVPAPFLEENYADMGVWQARLHELGWPAATRLVRFQRGPDGKEHWRELPEDALLDPVNVALMSDGLNVSVTHGVDFILQRAKPLEDAAWWLARLTRVALCLIETEDQDVRLYKAYELGDLRRQFIDHCCYLPAVKKKVRQERPLRSAAASNTANAERAAKAAEWRQEARRIASGKTVKGAALVKAVRQEMVRQGFDPPSDRSIRRALSGTSKS